VVPFTPVAHLLGFAPLPPVFFLILFGMVVTYLGLVEAAKIAFYAVHPRPFSKAPTTSRERHMRRVFRRLSLFSRHGAPSVQPFRSTDA
jgi:P-type Mg2+ transporter